MDVKALKDRLSYKDIENYMDHFGVEKTKGSNENEVIYRTICHGGNRHKLYFYRDTKSFYCYTNCGQMDIIKLTQNILTLNFSEAKNYICNFFKLTNFNCDMGMKIGFDDEVKEDYLAMFNKPCNIQEVDMSRNLNFIDKSILNNFHNYYHKSFLQDNISIKTMKKFDIKFDLLEQRIIIPHYDEAGNLIAVRCRNLDKFLLGIGVKYSPIVFKNKLLSAPSGKYFYGLDKTKEAICKCKKVIIVEAEKSVMQLDTMYGSNNISVALSSSNLSLIQINILKEMGVKEVIIALDKEYEVYGSKEEKIYSIMIRKKLIDKLLPYFTVSVMWDRENLLLKKDSPTDRGKEVFETLFKNRIYVGIR